MSDLVHEENHLRSAAGFKEPGYTDITMDLQGFCSNLNKALTLSKERV